MLGFAVVALLVVIGVTNASSPFSPPTTANVAVVSIGQEAAPLRRRCTEDKIIINNLLLTWASAAFTVGINTNARIMNLNESMTCNINVGSIVLVCAYHDGTIGYWNVAPGG